MTPWQSDRARDWLLTQFGYGPFSISDVMARVPHDPAWPGYGAIPGIPAGADAWQHRLDDLKKRGFVRCWHGNWSLVRETEIVRPAPHS
jgi:hypothetical protein